MSHVPTFSVTETKNVLIPMRDGVELAANLLLPDGAGPSPAIVVYFPYLKDLHGLSPIEDWQRHFATRGYACLTVDMRGTGASDGVMAPPFHPSEREDAVDLLAWIAARPWCDGNTGMWGISYSGSTALAAASMRPPSLKAIVPMHGTANEVIGFLRPHGCRPAWWTEASWGPMMTLLSLLPPLHRDPERRWARIWRARLARLEPLPFVWHRVPLDEAMTWATDPTRVEAATYAVSAWHDYYPQATIDYVNAIPASTRVMIGPWKHELPDLGEVGAIDHLAEMDRWWDRWLKGTDNGAETAPPVMIWHQGEDVWRYEASWPPARSTMRDYYGHPGGLLAPWTPKTPSVDRHQVDPTVGLHLLPWDPQAPTVPMPYDRSSDDHRSLTYASEPLADDLGIVGQPVVILSVAADQPTFPLSVALCDVAPSGRSTLICQNWVEAARTAGASLQPDRPSELSIPLYSTSYRLPAGHRLRLSIAGADFPVLWPAPVSPTLFIHGVRVRLPVTPLPSAPLPGPSFGAPRITQANPPGVSRSENRIERDLTGQTASFHQRAESSRRLADGSLLHLSESTVSIVHANRPGDTTLTAHLEARLERAVDPVRVIVDVIQTLESYVFTAHIEVAEQPYFARRWELALTPEGWAS